MTAVVGMIWIAAVQRGDRRVAYVLDVMVDQPYRRLGHATRAQVFASGRVLKIRKVRWISR